jgi:hypothetical protein|tara:strand:+ start:140 stop:787 length:648 start_codon:yes stop_codon:yes gene_type:complete
MALNKLKFNSINVTPAASEAIRFNSSANGLETASAGGSLVKISSTTISSGTSTVSITSGIDGTYKEYLFIFNNFHLSNDNAQPGINFSVDGGSNYNVTKTTTNFSASHTEGGSGALLGYNGSWDLAQSTGVQYLTAGTGSDNDQSASGFLHLFDPSNTTFVKHFIAVMNSSTSDNTSMNLFIAGYGNTTSAINAVQFSVSAGTLDAGTITLYGVT